MQTESLEIEEPNQLRQGLLQSNKAKKISIHSCLLLLCSYKEYNQFVTANQYRELQGLIAEAKLNADPSSFEVRSGLLELFRNAFPNQPEPALISQEWKTLGFQSENPMTDLRSSGKLSLENLLYFSDHYPLLFSQLVHEATDYPFIASAINITTLLLIHLNISTQYTFCPCCGTEFKQRKKVPIKEMAVFASFLEDNEWQTVFNEMFSLGVMLMDHNYRRFVRKDPSFTILEFRRVFVETKMQILAILRKRPESVFAMTDLAKEYLTKCLCLLK